MASQGTLNVQQKLENICGVIFADDERVLTQDYFKHKWAIRKTSINAFESPMFQLVLETKRKKLNIFGPIVKASLPSGEQKEL
jgi:hypothetical protein